MSKHTITAFYDSREYANNAVLMLRQAGIADADVAVSPETTGTYPDGTDHPTKGFWASLEEMFGGSDDHHTYAEGLRRGGIMVTAHMDDARVDDAVEILERHGSVDLNEREAAWRTEGWTGASAVTGGGVADKGAGPLRSMTPVAEAEPTSLRGHEANLTAGRATAQDRTASVASAAPVAVPATIPARAPVGDDVIQVVEETIDVGKRAVNRGKVRIHSYVVETPFSETISLRDETINVERRPVDRALGVGELGGDAFRDRSVEMNEIDEEAVVAKSARVVEEIGIRKNVSDQAQTVTGTLRSTKVDIEDDRTGDRARGAATRFFGDAASLQRAKDMDVIGSDGQHVGAIDHADGETIKLKRNDPASGGSHHLIPTAWVASVDTMVRLNLTAMDAMNRWTAA